VTVAVSQGASKQFAPHLYDAELLPERLYDANEQKNAASLATRRVKESIN